MFALADRARADAADQKKYNFSQDWTSDRVEIWRGPLQRFRGKPGIQYLEIGAFEGRATIWMLENVFTHPTARVTCIDIFPHDTRKILLSNLAISGFTNKAKVITGKSQIALKTLAPDSFDVIYIDGPHVARDVLVDAVLSWQLLKKDGLLIFDDYLYDAGTFPDELRAQVAIDAFITAYRNNLEVVVRNDLVIVRKKSDTVWFVVLDKYWYNWWDKE
ncbi:MAG: class I SAM-dependent methyltransferase, partial [bacterium]